MNVNILNAIINIVESPISELKTFYQSRNRANSMGGALEEYIKDIFAGTLNESNELARLESLSHQFSYLGNQNNPPDSIIRGGDAIEVKKIESSTAHLALNSSYPKSKLFSNSPMITVACRQCENWIEKDILHVVGVVPKENNKEGKKLTHLSFVYGIDYAADSSIYQKIKNVISDGVNSIPDVEFAQTNELGRVNRVDPLGITYLRIRGMWGIENPIKTFSYVYTPHNGKDFELMAIINSDKYNSFCCADRLRIEQLSENNTSFNIEDIKIKNPNNPSLFKSAKLITFYR